MVLDVDGGDGKEPKTPKSFGIENDKPNLPISGDVDDEGFKKVYINGVDVSILNETIKYYDADGKLITESIMEYSKKILKECIQIMKDLSKSGLELILKKNLLNSY